MTGKTVVITGATAGIGRVTAKELAAAGARVVVIARNREKAEETRSWILAETGSKAVELIISDLSVLSQVRSAAREVSSRAGGIDVLINNVGAVFDRRLESADGIEMTFALNHLAPFLLTNLLLDALKQRPGARVVTVSSDAHQGAHMDFDDLQGTRRYRAWTAYGQSKLANLLFTAELQRRLEQAGSSVIATAAHPGYAATNLQFHSGKRWQDLLSHVGNTLIGQSAEAGALPTLFAATADIPGNSYAGPDGLFEGRGKPKLVGRSSAAKDMDVASRLWEVSEQLTGTRFPLGAGVAG